MSAGEPSGDLHGAEVVSALRARWPGATIDAVGGPRMAAAGATLLFPMERLSAMGAVEIVKRLPAHLELYRWLNADFRRRRYDLFLPIDYPGFHLRVARAAREAALRVLYYIAPQLWAWRPGRARRLAAGGGPTRGDPAVRAGVLRRGRTAGHYVGHPLLDRRPAPAREAARLALGVSADERVLGIFPGSRDQEIESLWAAVPRGRRAAARGRTL